MAQAADIVVEAFATLKDKLSDLPDDQIRKLVIKTLKQSAAAGSDLNVKGDALIVDLKAALNKYAKPITAKLWKEYTMRAWLELNPDGKVRKIRAWDTFKSMKMKEIKLSNPNISFGDLMKAVSDAWKKEKDAALTTSDTTCGESTPQDLPQTQTQLRKKRTEPPEPTQPDDTTHIPESQDVDMIPSQGTRRRVTRNTK